MGGTGCSALSVELQQGQRRTDCLDCSGAPRQGGGRDAAASRLRCAAGCATVSRQCAVALQQGVREAAQQRPRYRHHYSSLPVLKLAAVSRLFSASRVANDSEGRQTLCGTRLEPHRRTHIRSMRLIKLILSQASKARRSKAKQDKARQSEPKLRSQQLAKQHKATHALVLQVAKA